MEKELLKKLLKIPGWLSLNEGLLLYDFAKKAPSDGVVVEIGSYQGKSTIFIALGLKETSKGFLYSIDPHENITHVGERKGRDTSVLLRKNLETFGVAPLVKLIKSTSTKEAGKWQKKINFLNVDGLHEYEHVKEDLRLWLPFLKVGGVVVCHDAFTPEKEVFQAVKEEIFDAGRFRSVGANDSQIFAVKGKPRNFLEKLNLSRSVFFLTLASRIWQDGRLPENMRFVLVNRLLKPFFLNRHMLSSMLRNLGFTFGTD